MRTSILGESYPKMMVQSIRLAYNYPLAPVLMRYHVKAAGHQAAVFTHRADDPRFY